MASGSKLVLFAALAGNLAVAATKFVAAAIAGSSSMLTEGIHSLVDSGNQVLMLYGQHRSKRPPNKLHPLGYGREVYFWSFVVALLIFTLGAGMSIYEGITHIRNPEMLSHPLVNYAVLGASAIFESTSLYFAVREFLRSKKPGDSVWKALHDSKDPSVFVVLFEDSAALIGLGIAAIFIGLTLLTGNPVWDGVGSVMIGLLLGTVAIVLARECKALLIGERASPEIEDDIRATAQAAEGVHEVHEVLTIQMAPDRVIVMIMLDFEHDLPLDYAERIADTIEGRARDHHPTVERLFIRPRARPKPDEVLQDRDKENPAAEG